MMAWRISYKNLHKFSFCNQEFHKRSLPNLCFKLLTSQSKTDLIQWRCSICILSRYFPEVVRKNTRNISWSAIKNYHVHIWCSLEHIWCSSEQLMILQLSDFGLLKASYCGGSAADQQLNSGTRGEGQLEPWTSSALPGSLQFIIQSLQSRAVREFITSLSLASVTLKVVAGKTFTEHGLPELASSKPWLSSSHYNHNVAPSEELA